MPYLWLKLIHVLAVVLFLGNIVTGVFWKAHADRTGDPRIISHALRGIIRSDRWFTVPGVFVIVLAGFGAAGVGGVPILRTGWILWSLVLFTISGAAFMARLVPLQRRLEAVASAGARGGEWDRALYARLSRSWGWWGALATATPLAATVLMILKPDLPAF